MVRDFFVCLYFLFSTCSLKVKLPLCLRFSSHECKLLAAWKLIT